ncbi:MAG: hypothetical protein ABI883_04680 [Chthoniobacterales bacterium]
MSRLASADAPLALTADYADYADVGDRTLSASLLIREICVIRGWLFRGSMKPTRLRAAVAALLAFGPKVGPLQSLRLPLFVALH